MKIPHVIVDARVYLDNELLPGQASVALPSLQVMSESVNGAGIAGELEIPVNGHFQSMQCKIDWAAFCEGFIKLSTPGTKSITVRGSIQSHDTSIGGTVSQSIAVSMKANSKTADLGKLEKASGSESSNELEVISMRVFLDNVEKIHIDKTAYIAKFDGVDYLESTRADLGI